jgi:hypothetical protein
MTKLQRFVALTAALGLTSWLAMAERALAYPPCSIVHGKSCFTWTYCAPDGLCVCFNGRYDCGE